MNFRKYNDIHKYSLAIIISALLTYSSCVLLSPRGSNCSVKRELSSLRTRRNDASGRVRVFTGAFFKKKKLLINHNLSYRFSPPGLSGFQKGKSKQLWKIGEEEAEKQQKKKKRAAAARPADLPLTSRWPRPPWAKNTTQALELQLHHRSIQALRQRRCSPRRWYKMWPHLPAALARSNSC